MSESLQQFVQQQQAARWPKPRERSAVKTALVALGAIPATELETAEETANDGVAATETATIDSVMDADAASQLLDFSCLPTSDPFQSSGSSTPPPLPLPAPNPGAFKVACPVCGGMFKPKGGTHHRKHQDVEYGGDCRGSGLPIAADSLA